MDEPGSSRNSEQLRELLREQISWLKSSSSLFDQGYKDEAKRLAVTTRGLLHDTRRSISLLRQLGIKDSLKFFNTAIPYDPRELFPGSNLTFFQFDSKSLSFEPFLNEAVNIDKCANDFISFDKWWEAKIIKDVNGNIWTRKDIVLVLANKDGGAHVDPVIDQKYLDLIDGSSINASYTFKINGIEYSENALSIAVSSMRQIAHELVETFKSL